MSTDLGPHELGRLQALAIEALGLSSAEDQRLAVLADHLHAVAGEHMVFREGATFRFDHLAREERRRQREDKLRYVEAYRSDLSLRFALVLKS